MKVAVIVGSLRKESLNRKLAQAFEETAPKGVDFEYVDISKLPLFNQDMESDFPKSALTMKKQLEDADGLLFVTPEYARSIPGVLKNAIDWSTRPWGNNSLNGKVIGITGATPGSTGAAQAQSNLRSILVSQGAVVMGQPEFYFSGAADAFDDQSHIKPDQASHVKAYIAAYVAFVRKHHATM